MRKLGKYEILGELGHGAMGVVYRARDPIINRLVALKTITTGLADDPNLLQRFYREAQSAGGLQHPNIVTIYDMGEEQNLPFIAMELIEGESLEQIILHRTNIPTALKLTYALQACRAFDYAHKRGIVHRDIKPGNVMVNKDGVVKVVDFGIARVLDTSKTQTGMLIGTFAYMSPEQYHGEHADERSDIWSFGVLLYELLCYARPFTGENPASLMHSICSQDPRPLLDRAPDCPPEMESIISKVLRKAPQDRFQSMEDLHLELEPVHKLLQSRSIGELIEQSQVLIERGEFSQARELLRESLKVDSGNTKARSLLDRVNTELRRLQIRPKAQQHVDKGRAFLSEGKLQEARVEVDGALQLDSRFEPAQELLKSVQEEFERARLIAELLGNSRKRLAEGAPEDAEALLAKVLDLDPANEQAKKLGEQAATEKAERRRHLYLLDKMGEARRLWTELNYDGCIALLADLSKEFPAEEEVRRLLDTVKEDQAEQHRQRVLESVRNLLTLGNCAQSKALLTELQSQFPADEEIPQLFEDIRLEENRQARLQALSQARSHLQGKRYDESIAVLSQIKQTFGADPEVSQLLELAHEEQLGQKRQQRIAEAERLLVSGKNAESLALLDQMQNQFREDETILKLQLTAREKIVEQRKLQSVSKVEDLILRHKLEEATQVLVDLEKEFPSDPVVSRVSSALREEEAKQRKQQGLAEARNLLAAKRYDDLNALLSRLQKQFPNDAELTKLQEKGRKAQHEQQKLDSIAKVRQLVSSRKFTDALALLAEVDKQHPRDAQVTELIGTTRRDQAKHQKDQALSETKKLLTTKHYDECDSALARLEKEFPGDSQVAELRDSFQKEKIEQEKQATLVRARNLVTKQNFDECIALLTDLYKQFPGDEEISRLLVTTRNGQAQQQRQTSLVKARGLVGSKRYDEAIVLLQDLNKEFPDEKEIARLLSGARTEQAEQQKQQELARARSLVAAQKFDIAAALLDSLAAKHPKDTAVQKLQTLVKSEGEKQQRSARLGQELDRLKKLINEKKYLEILAGADKLRSEFSDSSDLLRLIDFARNQQAQIENEDRLQKSIAETRALMASNDFAGAIRAADTGVKTFANNSELLSLRTQAEAQEKKQRARGLIEQRIRDIKFKINREKFSEAIDLANETIAMTGADTDLTQLLNSAVVEFEAREKKRLQEQKLHEIRTMLEGGEVDNAAALLSDAVETQALDSFDPRVTRVSKEIDIAKSNPTVASPAASNFTNEYAFSQGPPPVVQPETPGASANAEAVGAQAAASQPVISSQPVVSLPVTSLPVTPLPVTPLPALSPPVRESAPAVAPVAPVPPAPAPSKKAVKAARQKPAATKAELPPVSAVQPGLLRKPAVLAGITICAVALIWPAIHYLSSPKPATEPVEKPVARANPPSPSKAVPNVPSPARPALSPAEEQQQRAIALSDKLTASGDLRGALQSLQQAEKLNGPLGAQIKEREDSLNQSMKDDSLAKARQQEATLWQRALTEVDRGQFDAAKRDLNKIESSAQAAVHKSDAKDYLAVVIPRRQKEEDLYRQASQLSQGSDARALQQSLDLYSQVISLNGPRRSDAEAQQGLIQSKLTASRQETANREIVALEIAGRQNIKDADFNAARQKADQIRQAGGDPSTFSREIDQAQANQARLAQQQKEVARVVQPAEESQPPVSVPAPKATAPSLLAADQAAIQSVVQKFMQAFEQRDADAVKQVWPSIPSKTFSGYKNSFDGATAIRMSIVNSSVQINPDGMAATVSAQLEQQYTPKGQKSMVHSDPWIFQLGKKNGVWVITGVR